MTRTYCDCCGREAASDCVVDFGFPFVDNEDGGLLRRRRWELCDDCKLAVRLFLLRRERERKPARKTPDCIPDAVAALKALSAHAAFAGDAKTAAYYARAAKTAQGLRRKGGAK